MAAVGERLEAPAPRTAGGSMDRDLIAFLRDRRVGHLATADAAGAPWVVPVCYAALDSDGEVIVAIALDEKPKQGPVERLKRVRNIEAQPSVSLVVDDYDEDWSRLAWVLARGRARLVAPGEPAHERAIRALRDKYPQYREMAIEARPVIVVVIESLKGWRTAQSESGRPSARGGDVELAAIVRGRRSVRAFRSDLVPRQLVEQAIAAAGWAPSPHGRQPWRFAVVESPSRRAALAEAMAESWWEQLRLDGQDEATVELRLGKSRERLHRAPVLIVPCLYLMDLDAYPDPARQAAEATMAVQSLGAAIQNLLLSLYAAGVDGGWMCAPLFCPEVVRDALGLDAALTPHALIAVGYAAKDPVRRGRRSLEELIVSWQ